MLPRCPPDASSNTLTTIADRKTGVQRPCLLGMENGRLLQSNSIRFLVFIRSAFVMALLTLSACKDSKMDDHKVRNDDYFKNAKVLYVIDGQHYDIPMGYQWGAYLKYNQWPTPKTTYLETTSFMIFAMLPDMLPYSKVTKEKFDNRRGKGDIVDIFVQSRTKASRPISDLLKEWEQLGRLEHLPSNPELPEFAHYLDKKLKNGKESMWEDVYVPKDIQNAKFWIRCIRNAPAPGCDVYDHTENDDMPFLDYSFSIKHLPHFHEIRQGVLTLVASFKTKNLQAR